MAAAALVFAKKAIFVLNSHVLGHLMISAVFCTSSSPGYGLVPSLADAPSFHEVVENWTIRFVNDLHHHQA